MIMHVSGKKVQTALLVLVLLVTGGHIAAVAQQRLPPIPLDKMTDAQKTAAAQYKAERDRELPTDPYMIMLRTPEVMTAWHHIIAHVNSVPLKASAVGRTVLGDRLAQFAILINLREWGVMEGEWRGHAQRAEMAGLKPAVVQAVREGRRPEPMADDESALWDFYVELSRNKSVSDATYARALANLGEAGIVETINIAGLYIAVGMFHNVAHPARIP